MLKFVFRKMLNKKWMVLALLIGNILLVSITSGNPMYTQAVLQRTLTQSMQTYLTENNVYPGLAMITTGGRVKDAAVLTEYSAVAGGFSERFQLPEKDSFFYYSLNSSKALLEKERSDYTQQYVSIDAKQALPEHSAMVAGRMYTDTIGENNLIEAVVSRRALIQLGLMVDDVLVFPNLTAPDGNPVRVQIVGVFTNESDEDLYWTQAPSRYTNNFFVNEQVFEAFFLQPDAEGRLKYAVMSTWYSMLDYTAMRAEDAQMLLATAEAYDDELNDLTTKVYNDCFADILREYLKTAQKVTVTLWVLQAPIFALLAAFIFMVSRQMMDMEQSEIAVVKSRGAGKAQIFTIYLIQSLILALAAFVCGLPLGYLLCQVIGSANAFLEFVSRSALPVKVTRDAILFAGGAAALSVLAMLLPAMQHSRASIVHAKRKKQRKSALPIWQKFGFDFILLGISLYGLYSFSGQKDAIAARVLEGGSVDPLLFLSSSLFMIGAGLLAARIVPMIVWLIYRAFRRLWSPAMYASFLQVLRARDSQSFIMVFLIMTIALGVFNAQAARTINQNAEENLYYKAGADAVVQEVWTSNFTFGSDRDDALYNEPDIGRFEALNDAESIARVYRDDNINVNLKNGTVKGATLMAIHTKEFGETAWFPDDLLDVHWYHYLNAMSQDSRGVLVSSNFRDHHGCKLGDTLAFANADGKQQRGTIYGFIDYFPTYAQFRYAMGEDGVVRETEKYLIVANLQQVQSSWGVLPYQLWFKNVDGSDYLYSFIEENGIRVASFTDTAAELVKTKNDPVLQGTNGILTVGFIVVLLLCSVGFLIYWILSIRSRSLQFGIFRAMGMSMREVISMLLNEQLFISGSAIAVGALVGNLTSKLYMPLIQLAYAASDNALPLEVVNLASDNIRLFAIVGAVMLICMIVLGVMISRLKIAQALKLGED